MAARNPLGAQDDQRQWAAIMREASAASILGPGPRFSSVSASPYPEDPEVEWADYGKAILAGGANIVSGAGWLAKSMGADDIGTAIMETGNNAVDFWHDSMSDAAKAEMSKAFVHKNAEGEYEWGDASLRTVGLMGAESVLPTALGMGVGAGITKTLQLFANPAGRSALQAAIKAGAGASKGSAAAVKAAAAAKKMKLVDDVLAAGGNASYLGKGASRVTGAIGFGLGEGGVAGMATGASVYDQVMSLDHATKMQNERYRQVYESTDEAMSEAERQAYASETVAMEASTQAGWQAGLTTALLGAPAGAFFGRLIGGAAKREAISIARGIATGGAAEFSQEFSQSGVERFISNLHVAAFDKDLDLFTGVLEDAVAGGVVGFAMGAGFGAAHTSGQKLEDRKQRAKSPGTGDPLADIALEAANAKVPYEQIMDVVHRVKKKETGFLAGQKELRELINNAVLPEEDADLVGQEVEWQTQDGKTITGKVTKRIDSETDEGERARGWMVEVDGLQVFIEEGMPISKVQQEAEAKGAETAPDKPEPATTEPLTPAPEPIEVEAGTPAESVIPAAVAGEAPSETPAAPQGEDRTIEETEINGFQVSIQQRKGEERGSKTLAHDYGEIPGTLGRDGDPIDVYVGDDPASSKVFVANLNWPDGAFQQHKTLMNFTDLESATAGFRASYPEGHPAHTSDVVEMDLEKFREWSKGKQTNARLKLDENGDPVASPQGATIESFAGDTRVQTQYQLREADDLLTSNDESGRTQKGFPKKLQPRDRNRQASAQWLSEKSAKGKFTPELLTEGPSLEGGAPLVSPDGVVESGNGRVNLVRKVYGRGGTEYLDYLKANAEKFGLNAADLEGMDKPVLVRVRQDEMTDKQLTDLTRAANTPEVARLSPAEQARVDSDRIREQLERGMDPNSPIMRAAFLATLTAAERGGLMTAEGKPTKQVKDRIEAAAFALAYDSDRLLALMAEEADPDIRNILRGLVTAAPAFAKARAAAEDGSLGQLDIVKNIVDAAEQMRAIKAQGRTVDEWIRQQGLFGDIDSTTIDLMEFMQSNIRSGKRLGDLFSAMGEFVESEILASKNQEMFGDRPADIGDVINFAENWLDQGGQQQPLAANFSRRAKNQPTVSIDGDVVTIKDGSGEYVVERNPDLSPAEKQVEQQFIDVLVNTPWNQLKRVYSNFEEARIGEDGRPGQVLSVDAARELSAAYLSDRTLASAVHEPASAFIKRLYAERLSQSPPKGVNNEVVFLAGGTGAGKTTGLRVSGAGRQAHIVVDGNLAKMASAVLKIDQATASGKEVIVIYIFRDPVDSLKNGALPRAERQAQKFGSGRTLEITTHASTHVGSMEVTGRLITHYQGNLSVTVKTVDNSRGKGGARPATLAELPGIDYNNIVQEGLEVLEEAKRNGEISEQTYRGFKGSEALGEPREPQRRDRSVDSQLDQQNRAGGAAPPEASAPSQSVQTALAQVGQIIDDALSGREQQAPEPTLETPAESGQDGGPLLSRAAEDTEAASTPEQIDAALEDIGHPGVNATPEQVVAWAQANAPSHPPGRTIPPRFRREGQQVPDGIKPSLGQIRLALAKPIRTVQSLVNFHLVQSTNELPHDLEGRLVPSDVEGAWYDGTNNVYLVADNMPTLDRARDVFVHEVFGHMGMESLPEFKKVLNAVRQLVAKDNPAIMEVLHAVRSTQDLSEEREIKEVIALMAERGVANVTMGRLRAGIRNFLRNAGVNVDYTEEEVNFLIAKGMRDYLDSARRRQAVLNGMPEAQRILEDPDATVRQIDNALKEVYARQDLMDTAETLRNEIEALRPMAKNSKAISDSLVSLEKSYDNLIHPAGARMRGGVPVEAMWSRMYHGSPHKFDEFDISKIGTGEGAQAYGYGLYLAESEGVAKTYIPLGADLMSKEAQDWLRKFSGDNELAIDDITREINEYIEDDVDPHHLEAMRSQIRAGGQGSLYEVEVPDEAVARMLDFDALLSEIPEHQLKALRPFIDEAKITRSTNPFLADSLETAGEVITTAKITGRGKDLSRTLNTAGIPGIKYLDGQSRGGAKTYMVKVTQDAEDGGYVEYVSYPTMAAAEKAAKEANSRNPETPAEAIGRDGTRNLVVFDEGLLQIKSRNGGPVSTEQREALFSRGGGGPIGYKIIDTQTGQQAGKDYMASDRMAIVSVGRRAATRADKLDNEYGAARYQRQPIYEEEAANLVADDRVEHKEHDQEVESGQIITGPLNDPNQQKVDAIAKNMRKAGGFNGRPILVFENSEGAFFALTGSHRVAAAKKNDVLVPIKIVSDAAAEFQDDNGSFLSDIAGTGDDRVEDFLRVAGDVGAADLIAEEGGVPKTSTTVRDSGVESKGHDQIRKQLELSFQPAESQAGAPGLQPAIDAAVDALVDLRSTATVYGRKTASAFSKDQRVPLVGETIRDIKDLAILAQRYRDPRFETLRIIFGDKNKTVISQIGITQRLPGAATMLIGEDMESFLQGLNDRAAEQGATHFWMQHNHPSGQSVPSDADRMITNKLRNKWRGSLRFEGHVILDTNEYSVIHPDGRAEITRKDFGHMPPFTGGAAGTKITGPESVLRLTQGLVFSDDNPVLIVVNNRNVVQGVSSISAEDLSSGTGSTSIQKNRRIVHKAVLGFRGARSIAVGRNESVLKRLHPSVQDVILISDSGAARSLRAAQEMNVYGDTFEGLERGRTGRLSSYTTAEFDYLRPLAMQIRKKNALLDRYETVREDQPPLYSRAKSDDPEIESMIGRLMSTPLEDITIKDRFRSFVDRAMNIDTLAMKQGFVDDLASVGAMERGLFGDILDASESSYKAALATKNLSSVIAAVMRRGAPVLENGVFKIRRGREGVMTWMKPVTEHEDGNLLALWELYAAARRASRLINEKNRDGTSKEKNFTRKDIKKALALGEQYPVFDQVFKDWQKFNAQILDLAVAAGVIDAEARKIWAKNDYIPFYRVMEQVEYEGSQGPITGRQLKDVRSGIKTLHGSDKPLGNVFENMMMNTTYLIDAAFRNNAMQKIVEQAEFAGTMTPVPMAWQPVQFTTSQVRNTLAHAGLEVEEMTPEQKDQWVRMFRRVAPSGKNVVSVLVNGKPKYYEVHDPLLLRSIGSMGASQFNGVMNLFRMSKRLLTVAVTIDPAFMMANFIRDTLSTWVVTDVGMPPITAAVKGLKAAWAEDEDMLALMMAGAGGGGFYEHNPSDVRKMLTKRMPKGDVDGFMNTVLTPRKMWRFWQKVGAASEQANRIAVYRQVLANGGTVAEAAYQARDVLNFTMTGDYAAMKAIVQMVPFMNARIQGLYRLGRGARENPMGFAMKGAALTAATLALLLKNQDDPDYEALPEWDKDVYWHFFIGEGELGKGKEHFRLPKPFEVGALFATVPERIWRKASGQDDWNLVRERGLAMIVDTFAINPVPQLLKPLEEQFANRSMFTGSPIVGMALESLTPEGQYTPWTSETMKQMAEAMPDWAPSWLRSPRRLEAALRGYTGTTGMYILGVSDYLTRSVMNVPDRPTKAIQDYPVVKRFWRNPNPRTTKYSDEMYEMLNEANGLFRTMNAYRMQRRLGEAQKLLKENRGKLAVRGRLNKISTSVRKVNTQIRRIMYSELTSDQKRERIDALTKRKNKLMARVARFADLF